MVTVVPAVPVDGEIVMLGTMENWAYTLASPLRDMVCEPAGADGTE
jgi:hypothetical protein